MCWYIYIGINSKDLDTIDLVFKNNLSLDKLEAFKIALESIIY